MDNGGEKMRTFSEAAAYCAITSLRFIIMNRPSGSDDSYTSFSSSCNSAVSDSRKYVDPWDIENALYIRGKRISFASDPNTYCAASAVIEEPLSSNYNMETSTGYCYCESLAYQQQSLKTNCPLCDTLDNNTYRDHSATDVGMDSCEDCSVCSSVAPPPPLLLFSGGALSAAGLNLRDSDCPECRKPSFSISTRRSSVPARTKHEQLAYVYESPRARAKHSLPSVWEARQTHSKPARWSNKRINIEAPPKLEYCEYGCPGHLENPEPSSLVGPHAPLLAPPRHPCRWGMARSGHVSIDYSNAWMSLARRIRPSRL